MNIFDSLFSFITSIFNFFVNTITSLLLLIQMLLNSNDILFRIVGQLPGLIATSALIFISLSVVKLIVGR